MVLKTFESFNRDNEEEMNNILDRMNDRRGKLSDEDASKLNRLSQGGNIAPSALDLQEWLTDKCGDLMQSRENFKSFGRMQQELVFHNDQADVFFKIQADSPQTLYVSSELISQIESEFYMDREAAEPVLIQWFNAQYLMKQRNDEPEQPVENQVRKVMMFFTGF